MTATPSDLPTVDDWRKTDLKHAAMLSQMLAKQFRAIVGVKLFQQTGKFHCTEVGIHLRNLLLQRVFVALRQTARDDERPRRALVDFLREDLGLTGSHVGCEHGVCGACTVIVDGDAVRGPTAAAPTRCRAADRGARCGRRRMRVRRGQR